MNESNIVKGFSLPKWNVTELTGYVPFTTFWDDFSIADVFGSDAVQDTYNRVKTEYFQNYKYWTELCMVLNHKIWYHYNKCNTNLATLYDKLWKDADKVPDSWSKEQREYYFRITD